MVIGMNLLLKVKSFFEEIKLFFLGLFGVSPDDASSDNEYRVYVKDEDKDDCVDGKYSEGEDD